eukprot:scaffold6048_cov90-Cyclotella_meneghiniana.AAC.4
MYVNVNPGDRAIWDEHATAVHGVKATDECMRMKSKMRTWNGKQCDLKWLWIIICQAPNSPYTMPAKLQYFMDLYNATTTYKSCPIQHPDKLIHLEKDRNRNKIDSNSRQRTMDRAQIYLGCGSCMTFAGQLKINHLFACTTTSI